MHAKHELRALQPTDSSFVEKEPNVAQQPVVLRPTYVGREAGRQARAHLKVGVLALVDRLSGGAGLGVLKFAAAVRVAGRHFRHIGRRDVHEVDKQHLPKFCFQQWVGGRSSRSSGSANG